VLFRTFFWILEFRLKKERKAAGNCYKLPKEQ
jgi:hypothetical protein